MFDDINDIGELIGTAIGAGSMCWENVSGAGVFDSTRAAEISEAATQRLQTILAGHFANRIGMKSQDDETDVERVAEVIWRADPFDFHGDCTWGELDADAANGYRTMAQAAADRLT